MKQQKQRVIAIDYFRGLFILAVVINHAAAFSTPFIYLAGASGLWTSAAEMFMLLSGITLSIVRAGSIKSDFWLTAKKIWRRAGLIYLLDILLVFSSLIMALLLTSHNLPNGVLGTLPIRSGLGLIWSIINLSYSIGWASFLMYFAVLLVFAPALLYLLRTRWWAFVLLSSIGLFCLNSSQVSTPSNLSMYAIWQLYFVLGLTIGRFRLSILGWFSNLNKSVSRYLSRAILMVTSTVLAVSILADFNLYSFVYMLARDGWLPIKFQQGYAHLINHRSVLDLLLIDTRTGVLRPFVALLFLTSAYLLYQKYKAFLLSRTGKFINALGRDTLWIFMAQALAIPLIAMLPVPRDLAFNFLLTAGLIYLMWLVTQRRVIVDRFAHYLASLRREFSQAKFAAQYRRAD